MKRAGYIGNDQLDLEALNDHLGIHVIIELYNCKQLIENTQELEKGFRKVATESGATIVNSNFHTFSPYGVSGVVVIQESHFTIHTWPEHNYAAIDIFSCTNKLSIKSAVNGLIDLLNPQKYNVKFIPRGNRNSLAGDE